MSFVSNLYSCPSGWHTYCLNIEGQLPGKWYCPICLQSNPNLQFVAPPPTPLPDMLLPSEDIQTPATLRGSSVASSSQYALHNQPKTRSKGKGKARAISTDDEDSEDKEAEVEHLSRPARGRVGPKPYKTRKGRISKAAQFSDDEPLVSSPLRHAKRMRVHAPSQVAAPRLRRVRLHIGEEEEPKGYFDDILSVKDRDTVRTSIVNMDKQRFERSRILAEVHILLISTTICLPSM